MDRTTVKQAETEKTKRDVGGAAVGTHPRRGRSWEREGKGKLLDVSNDIIVFDLLNKDKNKEESGE